MAGYRWPQGCTHIQLPVALAQEDGSPYDLSSVLLNQITLQVRTVLGNVKSPFVAMTGTVVNIDTPATNGVFNYRFSSADVANIGTYEIMVVINYGTADNAKGFPTSFEIISAT